MKYTAKLRQADTTPSGIRGLFRCATCGDLAGWGTHPECSRENGCLLVTPATDEAEAIAAASTLGRLGGSAKTAAKAAAARENAKKGGRPRVFFPVESLDGPTRRMKLPPVQWEGRVGTLRALYYGSDFNRQIARIEEEGAIVYRELDNASFQGFAEMAGLTKKL